MAQSKCFWELYTYLRPPKGVTLDAREISSANVFDFYLLE